MSLRKSLLLVGVLVISISSGIGLGLGLGTWAKSVLADDTQATTDNVTIKENATSPEKGIRITHEGARVTVVGEALRVTKGDKGADEVVIGFAISPAKKARQGKEKSGYCNTRYSGGSVYCEAQGGCGRCSLHSSGSGNSTLYWCTCDN